MIITFWSCHDKEYQTINYAEIFLKKQLSHYNTKNKGSHHY